ncbi:MAG: hypothetical protein IJF92_01565 [Bacilli bacterium]|nr:hypothetical protein [Bacilli bacterium]
MKYFKRILVLVGIIVVIINISNWLHNNHDINYTLNNEYKINEVYKKENRNNNYYFKVINNKKIYVFTYKSKSNSKKIITNIKKYKSDKLTCILPIYKNNKVVDIYCLNNNSQVSSSYLKESSNKYFNNILNKVKKDKYRIETIKYSDKVIKKDYISIYKNNIKEYKYVIWFYKGIYIIDNNKVEKKQLLKKDKYNNEFSSLVNKYYITINTDLDKNSIEYKEIFLYDLIKNKIKTINLEEKLSINTYINGVYKNNLYLTDNDTKKQYKINPRKEEIIKIGDQNKGFKRLNNNKLITVRKNKDNIFNYDVLNNNISKKYGNVVIRKYNSNYYFKTKDGNLYQIINNNYNNPILLFKSFGIEELKIKDDAISFISDNTIYTYTDKYGLRPIIINNEMRYNNKNIYDYLKK